MKSRQRITVTTSQRLQLSLGLQASIRVLKADAAGLARYLEEQAAENPALILRPAAMGEWLPRWDGALQGGGSGEALDYDRCLALLEKGAELQGIPGGVMDELIAQAAKECVENGTVTKDDYRCVMAATTPDESLACKVDFQ